MTTDEMVRRNKCAYKSICDRLATLRSGFFDDTYKWCSCLTCQYYNTDTDARPPLIKDMDRIRERNKVRKEMQAEYERRLRDLGIEADE